MRAGMNELRGSGTRMTMSPAGANPVPFSVDPIEQPPVFECLSKHQASQGQSLWAHGHVDAFVK
jgi:hypothetical protein